MAKKIRGHGKGTIHQLPSGSWRVQIYHQGKRHGKTYNEESDALVGLAEMQIQLERGYDLDSGKILLN